MTKRSALGSPLKIGEYTWEIIAKDASGNVVDLSKIGKNNITKIPIFFIQEKLWKLLQEEMIRQYEHYGISLIPAQIAKAVFAVFDIRSLTSPQKSISLETIAKKLHKIVKRNEEKTPGKRWFSTHPDVID